MTALGWLYSACAFFVPFCWALTFLLRRRVRFQSAHRRSVHFPLSHFRCAEANAAPGGGADSAGCSDCGGGEDKTGHSADCPRITGERCPRCEKPKRTAYVCHYCGFAGFVIIFDLKRAAPATVNCEEDFDSKGSRDK